MRSGLLRNAPIHKARLLSIISVLRGGQKARRKEIWSDRQHGRRTAFHDHFRLNDVISTYPLLTEICPITCDPQGKRGDELESRLITKR